VRSSAALCSSCFISKLFLLQININSIPTGMLPSHLRNIMTGLLLGIGYSKILGLFGFWGVSIRKNDRKSKSEEVLGKSLRFSIWVGRDFPH